MSDTIRVYKRDGVKGEDGHKTFSIRVKEGTATAPDELAAKSNRLKNELTTSSWKTQSAMLK